MAYEYDDQARQEAAGYRVSQDEAQQLRDMCARKAAEFGNSGVRSHSARFSVAAWDEPPGSLRSAIPRSGRISRGDVLDLGTQSARRGPAGLAASWPEVDGPEPEVPVPVPRTRSTGYRSTGSTRCAGCSLRVT